jgi:type II secretory pathway pseudopilin PulG
MDLLKEENGTTILETLVVILLLGILVTLTASFFTTIFSNKSMLKGEALQLAQQEINRVLSEKSENDSTYKNKTENLKVQRIITKDGKLNSVEVMISKSNTDSLLLLLEASYKK